jgi:hypothetical protein
MYVMMRVSQNLEAHHFDRTSHNGVDDSIGAANGTASVGLFDDTDTSNEVIEEDQSHKNDNVNRDANTDDGFRTDSYVKSSDEKEKEEEEEEEKAETTLTRTMGTRIKTMRTANLLTRWPYRVRLKDYFPTILQTPTNHGFRISNGARKRSAESERQPDLPERQQVAMWIFPEFAVISFEFLQTLHPVIEVFDSRVAF